MFIFLFNKKYRVFDIKGASTKTFASIKKGNFATKIIFQIILNEVPKVISTDVRANLKQ